MKPDKKIAAFTLIELVVVMVLSGIIISLAFIVVNQVQQLYSSYENDTNNALKTGDFDTVFRRDFEQYDWINQSDEQLIFNQKNNKERTLFYTFEEGNIIRQTPLFSDTFEINLISMNAFFEGEAIYEGWVDSCSLLLGDAENINQQLHFNLKKTYSSEDLWKFEKPQNQAN